MQTMTEGSDETKNRKGSKLRPHLVSLSVLAFFKQYHGKCSTSSVDNDNFIIDFTLHDELFEYIYLVFMLGELTSFAHWMDIAQKVV